MADLGPPVAEYVLSFLKENWSPSHVVVYDNRSPTKTPLYFLKIARFKKDVPSVRLFTIDMSRLPADSKTHTDGSLLTKDEGSTGTLVACGYVREGTQYMFFGMKNSSQALPDQKVLTGLSWESMKNWKTLKRRFDFNIPELSAAPPPYSEGSRGFSTDSESSWRIPNIPPEISKDNGGGEEDNGLQTTTQYAYSWRRTHFKSSVAASSIALDSASGAKPLQIDLFHPHWKLIDLNAEHKVLALFISTGWAWRKHGRLLLYPPAFESRRKTFEKTKPGAGSQHPAHLMEVMAIITFGLVSETVQRAES